MYIIIIYCVLGSFVIQSFKEARKYYDTHVRGSFDAAKKADKKTEDVVTSLMTTKCSRPLVIAIDVTDSMGKWPSVIFAKLPYLDNEVKTEYLGADAEVSFAGVGDAYFDKYPLQARPFAKGTALKTRMDELVIEGGGGPGQCESYELTALYYARQVAMPNATNKGIFIFIADEEPYRYVDGGQAKKYASVDLNAPLSCEAVIKELQKKFAVYLIRKPFGTPLPNLDDERIHGVWRKLVGEDHISNLADPERTVDVIFGILAKETNRMDYFQKEIEHRQQPAQVQATYDALRSVHFSLPAATPGNMSKPADNTYSGRSVMFDPDGDKPKP